MLAAFVRCMAIIGWSSQESIDLLIPVLLYHGDALQESAMSGVLIQIKRRKGKGTVAKYQINQEDHRFFPASRTSGKTKADERPYITLVAELGVQPKMSPAAVTHAFVREGLVKSQESKPRKNLFAVAKNLVRPSTSVIMTEQTKTPSKLHIPQQPEKQAHPRDDHPRYSIFAYGCTNTVYKVIGESDRSLYAYLLANRDFLDEHPRKDAASLNMVRRMKPFWSAGPQCYAWINEPFLQAYHQPLVDDDGEFLFCGVR